MKKIWRVCLLALLLGLLLYGTALAEIYTVTIEPGEGSGEAFTVQSTSILSQSEMVAGNYDQTKGCFYDGGGTISYRLPQQCSFIAPDGQEFDYWLVSSSQRTVGTWSSGGDIDIASSGNLTVTAYWKEAEPPSSVMLSIPATRLGQHIKTVPMVIPFGTVFVPMIDFSYGSTTETYPKQQVFFAPGMLNGGKRSSAAQTGVKQSQSGKDAAATICLEGKQYQSVRRLSAA